MNVIGSGFGFHQLSTFQPGSVPSSAGPASASMGATQAPAHNTASAMTPTFGAYVPVAGAAFLSAGYFAAAPQMQAMSAAAAYPAAQSAAGGDTSAGHVTANATNSMASSASPAAMGGMPALGAGMGMAGMMAMPVGFVLATPVVMMPVFFMMAGAPAPAAVPGNPANQPALEPEVPVDTPQTKPAVDVVADMMDEPQAKSAKETVVEVDAAEFRKFRKSELSAELSTSLVLELTTLEGDSIKLDFNQLDTFDRSVFRGKTADGERSRSRSIEEDSQRVVNMSVDGELSAAERDSVDAVLAAVIEVANRFFENDMAAAVDKLQMMDFDTSTLADFSLKMTMSKSVDFSRVTGGSDFDGLQRLADRDGEISKVLEFFADEQRQLIDSASEVLDRPSAIKMVKSLLPPMLEAPLQKLADKVAEKAAEEMDSIDVAEPVMDSADAVVALQPAAENGEQKA